MRIAVLMLAAALVGLAIAGAAYGHSSPMGWEYSAFCCNGNNHTGDCQPIPKSSVEATSTGYRITLMPGQHRLVTRKQVFNVAFKAVKESLDEDFHACLYPTEDKLRCFYAPPMSF